MPSATLTVAELMKRRWRPLLLGLGIAILLATAFLVGHVGHRKEPVYQGMPLSFWVTRLGSDEIHGAPKDAVAAIRAMGPQAVPFLLQWMPQRQSRRPGWFVRSLHWCSERLHIRARQEQRKTPDPSDIEIAWWALGSQGKSAVPVLGQIISQPPRTSDDYSVWTHSAKAISFLGPDAIAPMLTAATNMQGKHEVWELLHNFKNLGPSGAPAVPAILHWAEDPDHFVRSGVVSALGGIGKRPDLAVPVLLTALNDSNSMVRRDSAEALGAFADESDAVLPTLIKTLKDNDWQARGGALSGLGRIRSRPETVVPLIAPFLSDRNSVLTRAAAYALRDLGSRTALLALLRTTNDVPGVMGIADIVYQAVEIISGEEEEKRRQTSLAKLAGIYTKGEGLRLPDLEFEGRSLSEILNNQAVAGPPLRLDQLLTLRQVTTADQEDTATFELPIWYDALTNIGTLRLVCDADPNEKSGSEAMVQKLDRATNGNCRLVWDTSYDPPGRHFLQAELVIYQQHGSSQMGNHSEQEIALKGPLFSFSSTNRLQFFLHGDTYTDYGAFFRVKLAQPRGSYSLELTTLSGEHIHTITGSTTNGIVEAHWDLLYDGGKRYTNESFNSTWIVTFPDTSTNSNQATSRP